jgi:hypothetical protein
MPLAANIDSGPYRAVRKCFFHCCTALNGKCVAESSGMGQALRLAPARSAAFFGGLLCAQFCLAQTQNSANRTDTSSATGSQPGSAPITEGERLRWYLKATINPVSLVTSAASAGFGQWRDRPREWRQGAEGFGLRWASSYGEHVVRETLMFGASSVFHEDNRYFRSGESDLRPRIRYAVESTFLARRDNGSRRLSFSRMGAFAGAALISRLWQPRSNRSPRSAAVNLGTSISVAAAFNVVREFWPRK